MLFDTFRNVPERKNELGFTPNQLRMILDFCTKVCEDPRMSLTRYHRRYSLYRRQNTTAKILKKAQEKQVVNGPIMFCNSGIDVTLTKTDENPLRLFEEKENDDRTTRIMALCGDWSFIWFRKGATTLRYFNVILPSYPQKVDLESLNFNEEGTLKDDPFPLGWDETDWDIYHEMRIVRKLSFLEVSKKLNVSRMTVKKRFEKMMTQCKVLTSFFPLGYHGYDYLLLTLKTKYEIGLEKALSKLDRSTFLYKYKDMIILILFTSPEPQSYNNVTNRFKELEESGIIHDLCVSIPIRWYDTIE